MENPVIPGWSIRTAQFDFGDKWSVAVRKGDMRYAVRVPGHKLTEAEAIEYALPVLRKWIAGR